MKEFFVVISLLLLLITTACSNQSIEETVVAKSQTPIATRAIPTKAAPVVVQTIEPTRSMLLPATSVITLEAPAPTSPPATPTPTMAPSEHVSVAVAPYGESICSDKYPCNDDKYGWEDRLKVSPGFKGEYFARINDFPTSLTFGPDGNLYIAARSGTIYSVDHSASVTVFVEGFLVPTGLAFEPGTNRLFVSNRAVDTNVGGEGRISVIENGEIRHLITDLPCCYVGMHGPNGIDFGPDGFGYVGVGGRADHGERLVEPGLGEMDELEPFEASILRFSPDGKQVDIYARGFRNPYDITWDSTGNLYATDNGKDPDPATGESPGDEVHLVIPGGEHGYPYYECSVCFGIPENIDIIDPIWQTIPHAAITGIVAYQNTSMPGYYDDLFVVLWSAFEGAQKVVRISPDTGQISDFATGFAQPIDITMGPDGGLYLADYATGIIFRFLPT